MTTPQPDVLALAKAWVDAARDWYTNSSQTRAGLTAAEAALASVSAPPGWVLVPVEPTEAMWRALWPHWHPHEGRTPLERRPQAYDQMQQEVGRMWRAMIASRRLPNLPSVQRPHASPVSSHDPAAKRMK
jgi:hypothetical protein